jgi:hypothetical protein
MGDLFAQAEACGYASFIVLFWKNRSIQVMVKPQLSQKDSGGGRMTRGHAVVFAIVGMMLLFFSTGCGADWRLLNRYDYHDGWSVSQYYDAKNIVNIDAGNLRVWVRQNNEREGKDLLEDLPTFRKLVQINCVSGELRYLQVMMELRDGDYEETDDRMDYLVPGDSKDMLSKAVCGGAAK